MANIGGKGFEAPEENVETDGQSADDDNKVAHVIGHDGKHQQIRDGEVECIQAGENQPPKILPIAQPAGKNNRQSKLAQV